MDFLCFPIWVWSSAIIMDPPFACPNSIIGISRITRTLFSYQNAIFRKKIAVFLSRFSRKRNLVSSPAHRKLGHVILSLHGARVAFEMEKLVHGGRALTF